jgi:caspase-like apoptosis-related cysteine protease
MSDDKQAAFYIMKHKKRGMAIIFNHETFDKHPPRHGTNKDRDKLEHTLKDLGFDVKVHNDLYFENIMKIVKKG